MWGALAQCFPAPRLVIRVDAVPWPVTSDKRILVVPTSARVRCLSSWPVVPSRRNTVLELTSIWSVGSARAENIVKNARSASVAAAPAAAARPAPVSRRSTGHLLPIRMHLHGAHCALYSQQAGRRAASAAGYPSAVSITLGGNTYDSRRC